MIRVIIVFILIYSSVGNAQIITTIVGTGARGFSGDGGPATNAKIDQPLSISLDNWGNLYIVDAGRENVRKVSPNGIISCVAGIQGYGYNGEGQVATNAKIGIPHGIVIDTLGNVYISEYDNHLIRKISPEGFINTIAGIPEKNGFPINGEQASSVLLRLPNDITMDHFGNFYFADEHNNIVCKISNAGIIYIIAGTGSKGYSGDGGLATDAELNKPYGVAVDDSGNIFISDKHNNVIRKINTAGVISTIAGNGHRGYTGDGKEATKAQLNEPWGIAVDKFGNLYISDVENNVIRCVGADGIIKTFAGNGLRGYTGDQGMASNAQLNFPYDVALDKDGNVYIADDQNHVVRKVTVTRSLKKDDIFLAEGYKVTSIPEKKELNVKIDSNAYNVITITDMSDNLLIKKEMINTSINIDISMLPDGHYFLNLMKADKIKRVVFIISE